MGHISLRDNLEALEKANLLYRIDKTICKDSELMALVKWQFRGLHENQRRAWLFTDIVDGRGNKFDAHLAVGTIGASREVYACALDCSIDEISQKWSTARNNPIKPVVIDAKLAPVKEVIVTGDDLLKYNLDSLPIPVLLMGYLFCLGDQNEL